ncbi:hypothetical protein O7632_16940 [Solwaraspora sp. WMMD406]|uniref:hypothetical protein n=1 Tax=Solwaraspora sp. WMMD406 TaxID=3016095 RepID=UPI002416BBA2|nr:hypothetical protein [Solwaraspora sp. WMMD406]MDG4765771.1 hypothetical protein [Solwaraspora sp. WMMD406]
MWAGRVAFGVIVAGLVVYLVMVGLDKADKLASSIGAVAALTALAAPYLLPAPGSRGVSMVEPDEVRDTGAARATGGGRANTGVDVVGDDRPARVIRSGNATAHGPGSTANTGVQRRPRP